MNLLWLLRLSGLAVWMALVLQCVGCATLSGMHEVISVDSNPRGAQVRIATHDHSVVGRTPFFVKVRRRRRHEFEFLWPAQTPGSVSTFALNVACEFRYASVFAGNGPLLLFYLPGEPATVLWYGLGVGLDVLTGAAYTCPLSVFANLNPQPVVLESQPKPESAPETCKKYLIVPPANEDEKTSNFIEAEWRKNSKDILKKCDSFADTSEVRSFLTRIGIDFRSNMFSPEGIEKRHLNSLGLKTGGTHLVFLRATVLPERMTVQSSVFDLHNLKLTLQSDVSFAISSQAPSNRNVALKVLSNGMSLLPNSIGYGYSQGALDLHATESVRG